MDQTIKAKMPRGNKFESLQQTIDQVKQKGCKHYSVSEFDEGKLKHYRIFFRIAGENEVRKELSYTNKEDRIALEGTLAANGLKEVSHSEWKYLEIKNQIENCITQGYSHYHIKTYDRKAASGGTFRALVKSFDKKVVPIITSYENAADLDKIKEQFRKSKLQEIGKGEWKFKTLEHDASAIKDSYHSYSMNYSEKNRIGLYFYSSSPDEPVIKMTKPYYSPDEVKEFYDVLDKIGFKLNKLFISSGSKDRRPESKIILLGNDAARRIEEIASRRVS